MKMFLLILALVSGIVQGGPSFLNPVGEKKDTVRIADQFEYGFEIKDVRSGGQLAFPRSEEVFKDKFAVVNDWQLDTLGEGKGFRAFVTIAPFEEGELELPPLSVVVAGPGEKMDTLVFDPQKLSVTPYQIDTAKFQVSELKGIVKYPATFKEIITWVGGSILVIAVIALIVVLVRKLSRRRVVKEQKKDPPYIVALRSLEQYRSDKYFVKEKQKAFYSGITDALKEYIAERFAFDAREMTTAELFGEFGNCGNGVDSALLKELKSMFEEADFVKFAKHSSDKDTMVQALSLAIRFVMETCRETEEKKD